MLALAAINSCSSPCYAAAQSVTKQRHRPCSTYSRQRWCQPETAARQWRARQQACRLAAMATADVDSYERVAVLAAKEAGVPLMRTVWPWSLSCACHELMQVHAQVLLLRPPSVKRKRLSTKVCAAVLAYSKTHTSKT